MRKSFLLLSASLIVACSASSGESTAETVSDIADPSGQSAGTIETLAEVNPPIFGENPLIEDLGGDFGWSEGPVWIDQEGGYLLFTDVPRATIWRYADGEGLTTWMQPSTLPGVELAEDAPGANGLFKLTDEEILVPDHGSRTLYALNVTSNEVRVVAETFEGRAFNSPNDVVVHPSGVIFFTDPPYGLAQQDDDSAKEQPVNGIYAVAPDGAISLIDGSLTRPNGIAISPDGSTLYVANSDPNDASFHTFPVSAEGQVGERTLLTDMTAERQAIGFGNPDGMAVATDGTLFVTAPPSVLALSPQGEVLSRINLEKPCANVTFGGSDKSELYMTCYDKLYRVPTNRIGL